MTRVVICANNIDEIGGAQRVVHVLADGLQQRGHDVLTVGITPIAETHPVRHSAPRRVLMSQPWPAKTDRNNRERTALRSEAVTGMIDILKSEPHEASVIITAQVWAMEILADALAAVGPSVRSRWSVIGQYHGSYAAAAAGRDLGRILRVYAPVSVFTALTSEDGAAFTRAGLNNVYPMPNPLAFWPASTSDLASRTKRSLLYLGRLAPEKGVDLLLDAWSLIADEYPDWTLSIVGDGPQGEYLRAQARTLAGTERIDWREPTDDPEQVLLTTDLLVLASLTEGLPLVIAEAQACGVPVVASDCSSGVRELLGDWGLLVPRGDSRALAGALRAAMTDEAWRLESGARARVAMQDYRLDSIIDRWERLLSSVLR